MEFETTIADSERYSGSVIEERGKKCHLIMTTDRFFLNLKNTERVANDNASYLELKSMLIDEIASIEEAENRQRAISQNTGVSYEPNQRQFDLTVSVCHKCGGRDHTQEECRRTDGKKKCYKCLKYVSNHDSRNCPEMYKKPFDIIFLYL